MIAEAEGVEGLGQALSECQDFSLVKLTPAHLDVLPQVLALPPSDEQARALVIGGEALSWAPLAYWRTHAPGTRLINEYGPTETVVGCCVYEVGSERFETGSVPIGQPIANTQLYILDRKQQSVPVGVVGELYIGGAGVARGYLNRPELTAEKFIPDPFSTSHGARLYRTGDLARRLVNGALEFLGRDDHQVKIRGYRIELGEIEAALLAHGSVREAAVVARGEAGPDKRLAAYVTLAADAGTHNDELNNELGSQLKRYLSERLPEYMIPAWLIVLDALPLTPNGKVDRSALPEPAAASDTLAAGYVAPRDETEARIADVWAEVLGVARVGVNDNFFDLGGHSLLATQVVSRLRREFNIALPLRSLFESPDVARLALVVAQAAGAQTEKELPEVAAIKRGGKSLEELLAELQQLSADEVNRMLDEKSYGRAVTHEQLD